MLLLWPLRAGTGGIMGGNGTPGHVLRTREYYHYIQTNIR